MKKTFGLLVLATLATGYSQTITGNIIDNGDGTVSVKKSWLLAKEKSMTSNPNFELVKGTIRTLPNSEVEKIVPGRADNPANVKRVERILTEEMWNYITPVRAPEYSYTGFLRAVGKFPAFCGDYTDGRDTEAIARKTLATALAHFAQETGAGDDYMAKSEGIPRWRQSLHYIREMGYTSGYNTGKNGYNGECAVDSWQQEKWPCGKTTKGEYQQYYGRGAKQLSYNFNYGPFSEVMYGDPKILLDNPELVADTWLNLASAIFFFVYPQPPKPSMLHVVDGTWKPNKADSALGILPGFGATINVINGGIECGAGAAGKLQPINRGIYYKELTKYLGVPISSDEMLDCVDQGRFDVNGSGAMLIQWEDDYTYMKDNPNGKSFACKLVGYQTAESALKEGDYVGCVQRFNKNMKIIDDVGDVSIAKESDIAKSTIGRGVYFSHNPVKLSDESADIIVVTSRPATVQIIIYDVLGNAIDIQESNGDVTDGAIFRWDFKNQNGNLVGNGSYLVCASVQYHDGEIEQFKRIIGIKNN